ncbi:MAG: ABC transporter substrate-binding protein [Rhodobacterales bacterium]|nr:ABC transporter substrate-binding protein [Rhodobacterales bacterium]
MTIRFKLKVFVAAGALALASLMGAAQAADAIKIGAVLSVTGPAGFLGDPEKKVLEHWVAKINKAGGVIGRPIELTIYDSGGSTNKAVTFTKRLVERDGVDLLIGGSISSTSLAILPLAEKYEIPFISLGGAVSIIDPVRKWVFKMVHTDRMAAQKIFTEMRKNGVTKIGMLSETVGYGKSGHDQALKSAPDYGIEVVADEFYGPKDADVTPQLTKIKNTPGVQAVLTWGIGQTAALVVRNYKQLGIEMQLYHTHGIVSKSFIDLAGAAAEGLRLPAAGIVVAEQLPENDPQKKVVMAFKSEFESTFKQGVSTFAGHAYDGLQIAVAAIERAGGTDKAKVRDEIEKTTGYVGTGGTVNMTPADHLGLTLEAFHMLEIRNGEWTLSD